LRRWSFVSWLNVYSRDSEACGRLVLSIEGEWSSGKLTMVRAGVTAELNIDMRVLFGVKVPPHDVDSYPSLHCPSLMTRYLTEDLPPAQNTSFRFPGFAAFLTGNCQLRLTLRERSEIDSVSYCRALDTPRQQNLPLGKKAWLYPCPLGPFIS
jgi:hypothetical protein